MKYSEMNEKTLATINMSEPISRTKEVADLMEEERIIRAKIIGNQRKIEMNTEEARKVQEVRKVEEAEKAPNLPTPPDFNSEIYKKSDEIVQYITKSGIIWYYNNPEKKAGLWRLNPYTKKWEQPDRKNPMYGLNIQTSRYGFKFIEDERTRQTARLNPYTGMWENMPYGLEDLLVPYVPLTSPQNILYIIDTQNKMLFRLNPYTHKWEQIPYGAPLTYGLPPPPPQPMYSMGPSMSFASTGRFGRGGRNRTSKKRYRNNITFKK
jgi:hypothetical protein